MSCRPAGLVGLLSLATVLGCVAPGAAADAAPTDRSDDIVGYWAGIVTFRGAVLDAAVSFERHSDTLSGAFTASDLALLDAPLATVGYGAPKVRFTIPDPEGALPFIGARVADTLSGSVALPPQIASRQGASRMTWRFVRHAPPAPPPYSTREVRISASGASLAATLFVPRPHVRPRPAVLILQGSSTNLRAQYRYYADRFARAEYVVLAFDKRGNGESTGDYQRATYDDLVADARAAFDTLASQLEVDRRRVGLWGLSQGAFLAPLVADKRAAFVVAVSSPGMMIAETAAYQDSLRVAWAGRPLADAAHAAVANRELGATLGNGRSANRVRAFFRRIEGEPWRPLTSIPNAPPSTDELRGWYWSGRTLDPLVWWRTLEVPVLLVYGEADELLPARHSAERLSQALLEGGNRDASVRIYPRANHVVRLVPSPLAPAGGTWLCPRPAPGYLDDMLSWMRRH